MIHIGTQSVARKGGSMKKEAALERKIKKVKQDLMKLGDMRPGSISVQTRKWGGEYAQLSYTHRGKGHTEYVPEKRRKEVESQTADYKKFRKLTKEWIELSMELCKLKAKSNLEK
jgi:hypothetical protein